MRKLISWAAVVAAVLVGSVHPARAATIAVASGTWGFVSDPQVTIRTVGGDTYMVEVPSNAYLGGLSGVTTDTDTFVSHHDGSINTVGKGISLCASCMLGARTGAFTATFTYTGTATSCAGVYTFTRRLGGLAGLQGGGTFKCAGVEGNDVYGTYSYKYWFAK
jgi:hypothetical protein